MDSANEQDFDITFGDKGGRLELLPAVGTVCTFRNHIWLPVPYLANFRDEANAQIAVARKQVCTASSDCPPIHFDYYVESEIGAQARLSPHGFAIGFSCDTLPRLVSWYANLTFAASDRILSVLRSVANANAFIKGDDGRDQFAYAMLLARIACRFLFVHEAAHVLHGHLMFLDDCRRRNRSPELVVRQTLEMDADASAVSSGINALQGDLRRSSDHSVHDLAFGSAASAIFTWYLSIYLLFRYHAVPGPIFEFLHKETHPPGQLRMVMNGLLFGDCLKARMDGRSWIPFTDDVPRMLEAYQEVLPAAIICAERTLSEVLNEEIDGVPAMQALSADAEELYTRTYARTWAEIRPELLRFALAGC